MASPQKENGHIDIANETAHALMRLKISGIQNRLLWVIWRKTYGWHKKEDFISLSQFEEFTGINRRVISRELLKLEKRNIITVQKFSGKTKLYSFQKDYEKWTNYLPISRQLIAKLSTKQATTIHQIGDELSTKQRTTKEIKETITKDIYCQAKPDFVAPILYLNEKTKSRFDPENKANRDLVKARYAEGRTLEDFKKVIDVKVAQWKNDEKMMKYLRPSTLFNRTNFENYLNEYHIITEKKAMQAQERIPAFPPVNAEEKEKVAKLIRETLEKMKKGGGGE